ncbi:PAS domain S-box protein [Corallococcus praedator]|uniref:histidine kinase n=1 Tax=Corallococcus praedator TaxID=2316724 RepID=A0ABX9QC09_9BACT|nr:MULTISPECIES: ATP-binding protein [Corallococcus]RKH24756.1 PAS domain S-box protein [Corallococcus sp. CA031C]RKI00912.1 PAS domain S-box protein [Corallococcus praedator]
MEEHCADVDPKVTEERLALLSVLQELTVAALDLLDPNKPADSFLDRVAERLGCMVALWLQTDAQGRVRLQGTSGLSTASRQLPIPCPSESPLARGPAELELPYPELASPGLVRWSVPITDSGPGAGHVSSALLLYFDREPHLPRQYRGMVERLGRVLRTALIHRQLFARTLDSERDLHQQKTLLESLSEASVEGILIASPDGRILTHNRRFVEMWGLEEEIQSASNALLLRAISQLVEEPARFLARAASFFEHVNTSGHDELRLKDGRVFDQYNAPVVSADGVYYGRAVYFRDITARQRTERDLQRERDFSSAVLDTARALVIVLDPEGRIVRFNRACQEMTGYSFEELRGAHFWKRLQPLEERERVEANYAVLAAGQGHEQYESHWLTREGELRLISWSSNVLRGETGAVEYVIGTGIDITEQRRAEQERDQTFQREQQARARAEEQEARSALLAEASGLLAGELAPEDALRSVAALTVQRFADWCTVDLLDADQSFQRITEARSEALRAMSPARVLCSPPDLNAAHGPGRVLRLGEPEFFPEGCPSAALGCMKDSQGEAGVVEFESWMSVPLLARGHTLGAITLARSEAGGRYGPAEFALAQELGRRAAMAVDNARLYQQAQMAIGLRDEFLSIASHELKTPVTSLQLSVQGLMRLTRTGSLRTAPVETVTHSLEVIERQAKRMAKLVNTLLDVSRIHAGRLDLELEEVDLAALVRDIAARFAPELATSGTRLLVHADTPMPGVWDRSRLDQIVTNLLSNAIKYGEGRPIEIRVEGDAVTARLEVRDQGIGIPVERHVRIFRAFERAVSSRHYGGLGLGLHIVNQLVERLGGSVRVESETGRGATFTVELPRRGPSVSPPGREGLPDSGLQS